MVRRTKAKTVRKRKTATRRKQKAFFRKAGLCVFLITGAVSAGLYLAYFSPYFQIDKIEVRNAKMVSSEDLEKAISEKYPLSFDIFGWEIGSKSIMLPFFNSASLLSNFPQIEKLSLSREFPNVLALEVKEREPFAVWCKDWDQKQDCSWTDKNGISFRGYDQGSSGRDNPLVIEEKESFEAMAIETRMDKKDFLDWSAKLKKELDGRPEVGNIVKFAVYADKLVLRAQAGFDIYLDTRGDLAWQKEKLRTVLEEKICNQKIKVSEYIDLRFGNQAVIK
ncbi:MAG: hypothetical protein WC926_01395 [Candidatus Paceibacterota bacterium]|jgi:hypothetical protein